MADDPYRVLGVSPDASEDEIKAAYRTLAKKYHPDVNHAPDAEAKMKEINDAYSQLIKMKREGGRAAWNAGYGGSSGGGNPYSGNPFGGGPFGGEPFGGNPFGDPFRGFGGGYQQQRRASPEFDAVRRYIQAGQYAQALNMLNALPRNSGEWYYLDALANMGMGNRMAALNDARQAVSLEPGNLEYRQLLSQLEGGAQSYRTQGGHYGFPEVLCGNPCLSCCLANALCNCLCNCGTMGRFGMCC